MHKFFATKPIFVVVCVAQELKPHNAGWHKWSLQLLDYLGEYKILPLFLPSQKSPKLTNVIMDGMQQQGNATIKQNKTKAKPPTPMGTCNGHSPHPPPPPPPPCLLSHGKGEYSA